MSLFPRIFASEFAPVFRLIDEVSARNAQGFQQAVRSFQPRFDVKENKDSYVLQGELPGLDQKDIQVEWTESNVLSIKGRTERHREEGTQPAAQVASSVEQRTAADTTESETSSNYHKASVEEEGFTNITTSEANPEATPAETPAESVATETKEVAQAPQTDRSRYWVAERSVGSFSRTFSFPNKVDHDNIKASLKNGLLNIIIGKKAPENRQINVE